MSIIVEPRPHQKKNISNDEMILQSKCVLKFKNAFPDFSDYFWATFNEGKNASQKLSCGMTPGVSDLIYFEKGLRGLIGIELKWEGTRHKVSHLIRQANWLRKVPNLGCFCDSIDMFWDIVTNNGRGIDPDKVLIFLSKEKKSSIIWNRELFS